jgi:hypothetical protein
MALTVNPEARSFGMRIRPWFPNAHVTKIMQRAIVPTIALQWADCQ